MKRSGYGILLTSKLGSVGGLYIKLFYHLHCNTSGKPILLIWDGHRSHCTSILLLKAYEHNILILRLPPHCTHKLQPLDVGVFGPLQAKFADVTDEFVGKHYCGIRKSDFVSVYMKAQEKAISCELIKSAFRHCGVHPLNVDIFDTESFAPSQATSTVSSTHLPSSFPTSSTSPSEEGEQLEEWDHASTGYSSDDSEIGHDMIQAINSLPQSMAPSTLVPLPESSPSCPSTSTITPPTITMTSTTITAITIPTTVTTYTLCSEIDPLLPQADLAFRLTDERDHAISKAQSYKAQAILAGHQYWSANLVIA